MQLPANTFKRAIREGRAQIGLWAALADPYVTELIATAGFDWLLIDGEHAPNNVRSILPQLQAAAPYPVHCVVRPVVGEVPLIKQYLDIGTQTLLIPMVETPAQAAEMVAATRYPPHGVRGVGSAIARASRWSGIGDYLHEADKELCVLVQAESVRPSRIWMRSLVPKASMGCSSGLPICPHRWVTWASRTRRKSRR
jgi:4-hydroxy-2-oxoheptanedioate aldolase